MEDKVSIIIPVYYAENTIKRCVESLALGTYSNIEIILIEDCSPDNSWEICLQLQNKYSCVKAYRNLKNSGPSATRNYGLQIITGNYLMFVDSDDWVEPNFVSSFMNVYQKYQPDLIVSGYMNHDEIQNATTTFIGWKNEKIITVKSLKKELLSLYHGRLLQQVWNKLFLTKIVRKNHLLFDTEMQMGEDFRFLLSYLEHTSGDKLVQINEPLYHYIRCSGKSLMSQFGCKNLDGIVENLKLLYAQLEMSEEERIEQFTKEKESQINLWAYLIMHNVGMKNREKRKLILTLDAQQGWKLYKKNVVLYYKEKIMILIKRTGIYQ